MSATTITKNEWRSIMTPLLKTVLPRAGFSQSFKRVVLHGPTEFQGMGWMEPWHKQELTHLYVLVDEVNLQDIGSNLILQTFEDLRTETGLTGKITDWPYSQLHHLTTDTWLTSLWKSMNIFGIEIEDTFTRPTLLR